MKKHRGFTLIELLVVIAIIGILAGVVITNLAESRKKARDTKRLTELHSIENALELYFNAHNSYPGGAGGGQDTSRGNQADGAGNTWGPSSNLQVLKNENLIGSLPVDPLNTVGDSSAPFDNTKAENFFYNYFPITPYSGCGQNLPRKCESYELCARLEANNTLPTDTFGRYCVKK